MLRRTTRLTAAVQKRKKEKTPPLRDSVSSGSLLNYAAAVLAVEFVFLQASFTAAAAAAATEAAA